MLNRVPGRLRVFPALMNSLIALAVSLILSVHAFADDALERRASWHRYDDAEMTQKLRASLDTLGVAPDDAALDYCRELLRMLHRYIELRRAVEAG